MSVFGTMMLRAGLLSENQAVATKEHAAARSISEVDAILELGLADEDTLVAFLASKLMIPRVRAAVLDRVPAPVLARIPAAMAWEYRCVPVSADELGNLTVAMTDPTEPRAITAIAEHTGAYLVRAVGSASDLRRAVERLYGPRHATAARPRATTPASYSEAERPTELGLEPIRGTTPPPGIRNPAPPLVSPTAPTLNPSGAAPAVAPPAVAPPVAPPVGRGSQIGQIPDDDDDAVPIRQHAVAQEVASGPAEQRRITDVQTSAPTHVPAARPPARPSQAATLPPTSPPTSDPHERPTYVETRAPDSDPSQRPTVVEAGTINGRGPRRPRAHTPWNPPLQGFNADPAPLSPEAFAAVLPKLEAALDRDAVTAVLLDFLAAGFGRVILFVHSHGELRGLDARGKDLLVEAVRQVRIPSSGKSMFSDVLQRGAPFFGPIQTSNKIDQAFASALGGVRGNVLLLPITIGRKIPLLLWAHGTSHPVDPRSITELSHAVSEAIQRIIAAARR